MGRWVHPRPPPPLRSKLYLIILRTQDFASVYAPFLKSISPSRIYLRTSTADRTYQVAGGMLYGMDPKTKDIMWPAHVQPAGVSRLLRYFIRIVSTPSSNIAHPYFTLFAYLFPPVSFLRCATPSYPPFGPSEHSPHSFPPSHPSPILTHPHPPDRLPRPLLPLPTSRRNKRHLPIRPSVDRSPPAEQCASREVK
jgi:hypothetical protein